MRVRFATIAHNYQINKKVLDIRVQWWYLIKLSREQTANDSFYGYIA